MQTAVRGGHLTPFIHPFLVKPSDARGIDGSFQGFDAVLDEGWRLRDERGTEERRGVVGATVRP